MSRRLARLLHAAYAPPTSGATDADLLARWAGGRDPTAFELLVRRHAGLVWRVCRATARDHHAAEDAFQATFLALARRPGAVREASAAGWLYRVGYHAALKARGAGPAVGLRHDPPSAALPPDGLAERAELGPILQAEVSRLPGDLRAAVVLCHLEGLTQAEAAARLGWPLGTVATRVRRGCDRLRDRLVRRGVGPAVAGGLVGGADAGAVSPKLVGVAAGFGAGAVPGPGVVQLTTGVLLAMSYTKLKVLAVGLLVATAAAGGVATWAGGPPAGAEPAEPAKRVPPPAAVTAKKPLAADFFDRRGGMSRLKSVALAIYHYTDTHDGRFPADLVNADGKPLLSWRVAILPYLDEEFLATQFRLNEPWDSDNNQKLAAYVPKPYRSPRTGPGLTRVQGFAGPGSVFEPGKVLRFTDLTDGTSNTLLAVEAGPPVPWTKPADLSFDPNGPPPNLDGPFADGFATTWADGSSRFVRRTIGDLWLRRAIRRDDGQPLPEPQGVPGRSRPLSDREKAELERLRMEFAEERETAERAAKARARLTDELRRFGPLPVDEPKFPAGDDLDAATQACQQAAEVSRASRTEAARLWAELERRDPKAAARLQNELYPPAKK